MIINIILLAGVYGGVQHYTHHHCIAISAICALLFLSKRIAGASVWLNM